MNWHLRYLRQAAWTRGLRDYLFDKTRLSTAARVLEVGCGTGAVLATVATSASLHGLDVDAGALSEARQHVPGAFFTRGDARLLPYADHCFDTAYCHFLLLWVSDPLQALTEMKRVTKSNGYILALAEPDYGARTDRPEELAVLGARQNESLRRQGADIRLGARLAELFFRAGITIIETGAIQGRASDQLSSEEWQGEWEVLESDLAESAAATEIAHLKRLDEDARRRGTRVLNVPTYFAWGQV
ncbi:MAG TPA: class I SAM-dependent methyltransferase [Anaerolineales bacterium]|nr:class I SAM-dependent methyltransferase [Anaerolineales bacterium]